MAGESGAAYIPAVGSGFVTKWQGSGAEAIRKLFACARRYAPAIIFIDEIRSFKFRIIIAFTSDWQSYNNQKPLSYSRMFSFRVAGQQIKHNGI
jgi:AAA+ superfamily predicted ATPase